MVMVKIDREAAVYNVLIAIETEETIGWEAQNANEIFLWMCCVCVGLCGYGRGRRKNSSVRQRPTLDDKKFGREICRPEASLVVHGGTSTMRCMHHSA